MQKCIRSLSGSPVQETDALTALPVLSALVTPHLGINNGEAAGQTVMHLHVHLIPRYKGDTEDPRGGVRLIFPRKAKYWED